MRIRKIIEKNPKLSKLFRPTELQIKTVIKAKVLKSQNHQLFKLVELGPISIFYYNDQATSVCENCFIQITTLGT